MQKIDWTIFLAEMESGFGNFNSLQIQGLGYLIDCLEADNEVVDLRWGSYMLSTAWHETGHTFQPVEENGKGKGHKYGIPDPRTGKVYYGRGLSQLTFYDNYELFGKLLHIDLINHPEKACEPDVAYQILSIGMRRGLFTGVGLPRYFNDTRDDPINARKIINSLDCAEEIAGYHKIILGCFKKGEVTN